MNESQLQFLWDNYANNKGFKDFNEFKGLMANPGSRKVFFDASNKELGFNNISDFEETLGLKKKQTTPSVSDATPSASQKIVKQSGRELTTDISKFQQDPTAPPIVLTEEGKKTYVAPEPTPQPEEKKFKYDEASFSKMVKGMQEYQQGKTKDIQDFADPRLNKTWNEIKDKQSKNYNDPIGNFSSAVIQKASDLVPKRVSDAWNKGLLQGEQANIVNLGFEEMTDEDVNRLSRIEQELSTYTPSKEEQKFAEGGLSWVINNPVDGAKFIGETILNSLASQIKASTRSIPQGVAVGAAAGAPIGGVGAIPGAIAGATAGTIMAGLNIETSQKILQSIKDAGFDLKNPEEIRQAFSDRDMIEKFRISGLKRGVPIAIIDVFTAGIAGKVAKGGSTMARSVARKGAGLGVEAIGGSTGEFVAQVASGEEIDPNAIALEGIAEVGAGAPTLVTSTAYQGALERKNTSSSDKNIALQITANKVAGDEDARNHLKKLLSEGTIDEIEFKDGIKVIEESKVSDARIPDNIVGEARAESIVLMNRKTDVQNQIRELEGKKNMMDEVYHPEIDQQIEVLTKKTQEIDNELINTQKQNDAIQKQTTDEGVLRTEQPQVGLQEVGEGDQVTEVITEEAKPKEEVVKRDATVFSFDNLNTQPLNVLEDKAQEVQDKLNFATDINVAEDIDLYTRQLNAINKEIELAKEQVSLKTQEEQIPLSPKREEVKTSLVKLRDDGLLVSAKDKTKPMSNEEIDAQMSLTDAMSKVWKETTGKDDFYEANIDKIKEGNLEELKTVGGVLYQDDTNPQQPITRVTLGVLEMPEFKTMAGKEVSPQSISDMMKSRGKQIEKDIVAEVLDYDKYKGQKRINFDEFRNDVDTQVMKLEKIKTTSYSSYGMDNLGDNEDYGNAETIVFNSPINHGETGHFGNDFYTRGLKEKNYELRQIPGTNQYAAVDTAMPSGVSETEIASYVGTAGTKEQVEKWISDRRIDGTEREINKGLFGHIRGWFNDRQKIYNLAELQSDYFQKNKASDIYTAQIPKEEIDDYRQNIQLPIDNKFANLLKDRYKLKEKIFKQQYPNGSAELVIVNIYDNNDNYIGGGQIATNTLEYINNPDVAVQRTLNRELVGAAQKIAMQIDSPNSNEERKKLREIQDEYEKEYNDAKEEVKKYTQKRAEEIKNSKETSVITKQFVASQKIHELRLFREAIKHAADEGAEKLRFPTPYTLALIEGYVSEKGDAPYEVTDAADESQLEVGDTIDYGGEEFIVISSGRYDFRAAPKDDVSIYNYDDLVYGEVDNRLDELRYDLDKQVNDINNITRDEAGEYDADNEYMGDTVKFALDNYFSKNKDAETVSFDDIENNVREDLDDRFSNMDDTELISWAYDVERDGNTLYAIESRSSIVNFNQPDQYDTESSQENFEDELNSSQQTVVDKYKELDALMMKMRPDARVVTDDNGREWIETDITEADSNNPIIAFQEEGGKAKGAIDFVSDNKASIYIFKGADISTLAHEATGHLGRNVLEKLASTDENFAKDYEAVKKWANVKNNNWTTRAEEKFARGFERYLREGKAPTPELQSVFAKLKTWLTSIYKQIKGSSIDIELTPAVRKVFDNLLGKPQEEVVSVGIEELLTADTKDATVLNKLLTILDDTDNKLKKFGQTTAGMNISVPVMRAVIKTLKALVKTGITLQEAIIKAAKKHNVSKQDVIDSINLMAESKVQEGKMEGVSEIEIPGYNDMMDKANQMIARQTSKNIAKDKIVSNVEKLLNKTDAYKNASDVQKEAIIRDVRKQVGLKEKSAPSVARLKQGVITETEKGVSQFDKYFNDFVDEKKITMSERKLRDKQLMDLARGGRDAKIAIANASKELGASVKKMADSGKLTAKQAANITKKFSKVNLLSLDSVSKFSDYVSKIFADADYDSKLNEALSTKKAISKLSRNKDKNANTRYFAKKFLAIDPSLVDNIDEYNDNASRLKESIKGSMLKKSGVKFADIVNIDEMSKYVDKTIDSQNKKLFENKVNEIQELMGIDASDLSYEKILELLKEDTVVEKKYDDIIRSTVYKMFNTYSALIDDMISSGKDSFTGEEIDFTDNQKSIVKKFMNMDLDSMSIKSALSAVDALANFMQNKSTAKMEDTLSRYEGDLNAKRIAEKGIKSKPLQKYWSRFVGRLLTEQLANLNIVFERMFGGFNAGGKIQDAMGVTDLVNKKSAAQSKANKIVDKYVQTFYETKPNGEAFNTEYNNIERGMAAFLMRNVLGTSAEIQAEFNRRKDLVKESIDALSVGSEVEQQKSEVYKKAFDKIAKDSKDASDVTKKIDKENLKAVDFWQNTWSENYDEMSNVSENIYNKVLEKDLNYTPDKFSKLDSDLGVVELTNDDSAFHTNNGTIYKKESGVLMEATRPDSLPTNPKNGEVTRYIDLSFDSNMSKAMYDALVDINTAYPIRQIDSFLNSKDFSKIVPQSEDRKVLRDRIQLYVNNIRGKNPFTNDELSSALKKLNSLTAIGVGQALAGVTQPVKQVLPVAVNTLINAGSLDIQAPFDVYKNNFISNSGYAIANRGVESQAQIESLNRMIETASKTKGQKLVKAIENANAQMLEWFLVKPDVYIARASWLSYYEKSLKNQGVDVSNIDYKTHELNKEAASYAQRMVDRQQNVSDIDMSGKLLSKKETSSQILVKLLLSFASFRMNQAARLGSDLAVLSDKTSTAEDKSIAARSVAGFGVELATFKIVSAGLSILIGTITKSIMGQDEDDEERNKRINDVIKGQVTGTIPDIISPVPILDKPIQAASKAVIDFSQEIAGVNKEDIVSIYDVPKQDFVSSLGSFGIAAGRASTLWELGNLSASGTYEDNFGNEKQVSDTDREALSMLLVPAVLTNIGLAPSEVNTVVRNAIKYSKQKGKTEKSLNKPTPSKKEKKETSDSSFGKKSGFGKGSRKSGGFGSKSGGFGN
jgi:hypothetical protein